MKCFRVLQPQTRPGAGETCCLSVPRENCRSIQAGLKAANVGDIVAAEDVEAEAKAWRIEARRKPIRSGLCASWFDKGWDIRAAVVA